MPYIILIIFGMSLLLRDKARLASSQTKQGKKAKGGGVDRAPK